MNRSALLSAVFAASFALPRAALADDVFISVDEAKVLAGDPNTRFVFCDHEKTYAKGHIPGSPVAYSHDMQYLDDVRSCKGLPMCEATAARFIGELGIDATTRVVVYDSGIGVNASGTWFFLRLYGHDKVQILDGGLATWKAHGGAVAEGAPPKIAPKTFVPKLRHEMIATVDDVKKATSDPAHFLILDARHNLEEYTGKTLQASMKNAKEEVGVPRGGFIPTAVFSPWSKYAGNKAGDADKPTLRDAADLAKQIQKLEKNGYARDKTVISYCHVGLGRGSFQYLAFLRGGHANVKLYVGSWSEWGSTETLPVGSQL